MTKRKFQKGKLLTTLDEFSNQTYIWFHDKVYHSGWFKSWQFRYIEGQLKLENIFSAEPVPLQAPKFEIREVTSKQVVAICPICSSVMQTSDVVLTSYPSQLQYVCPHCDYKTFYRVKYPFDFNSTDKENAFWLL